MREQFNIASLTKLTKAELQALLATAQAQLNMAADEVQQVSIRANLVAIKQALSLK